MCEFYKFLKPENKASVPESCDAVDNEPVVPNSIKRKQIIRYLYDLWVYHGYTDATQLERTQLQENHPEFSPIMCYWGYCCCAYIYSCLRAVNSCRGKTTRYAGRCKEPGSADGQLLGEAAFSYPHVTASYNDRLFVTDINNHTRMTGHWRESVHHMNRRRFIYI